jgi:hypothetical protein
MANVGLGDNTLAEISLAIPGSGPGGTDPGTPGVPGTPGTPGNPGGPGATNPGDDANGDTGGDRSRSRSLAMINDMSARDRAKAKASCKDVVRSGGFEAGLVSLCKMVMASR